MRTLTRSPTRSGSRSRRCASDLANRGSSPPSQGTDTASTLGRTRRPREGSVDRSPGLSVRLKLTLSYAGFVMLAGVLLLAAAWLFLNHARHIGLVLIPGYRYAVLREFAPTAAVVLVSLFVFGLVGGWFLAGRMLSPLAGITGATRIAATGSLSHRIRLPGHGDEFRELADAFDAMLARLEAHVSEQRRFAANASHELRTPLAITQSLLDVARN